MNKELIALKHSEIFDCGEYASRTDMMLGFLSEIDAEHEKEAVAWMTEEPHMLFFDKSEAEAYCDENEPIPLYLCQAIPEGQALPTSDWAIDTSTGHPILTYQNCSVIQDEMAIALLRLIQSTPIPEGMALLPIEQTKDSSRLDFLGSGYFETDASGGWNEEPTYGVHKVTGNRNDRQFKELGRGDTIRQAIDKAMLATAQGERPNKDWCDGCSPDDCSGCGGINAAQGEKL